ncbi:MAG: DNA double-strand break repair nuclease NurA, partial [Dehalococcoidia bacterium]
FNYLSAMAAEVTSGSTALALTDGSLLMWSLTGREYPDYLLKMALDDGILKYFEKVRQANDFSTRVLLASYISLPRSTDVINTLRLVICPHSMADCDKYCSTSSAERPCDVLSGLRDRDLFWQHLDRFQRSDIFASQSRISKSRYGNHQVYFFYLKLEDEVARIEVPEWVARDRPLLELVHSLVVDQCARGHGYPVALSEAHELAVVSGSDRDNFYRLIDEYMAGLKLSSTVSAKSLSKRTRWI